jgi:predicted Abi (CAAX) family protease
MIVRTIDLHLTLVRMRVVAALKTIPDRRAWARCALVYGIFLICAFPIGLLTGLLQPGVAHVAPAIWLGTSAIVFVHPACVEEFIFRVLLLPRSPDAMPRGRLIAITLVALALYVVSHPLNAMLFRPEAAAVFERPAYLMIVALLGITCTAAYWISKSIWPPVAMHWLTVVLWLWLLGGQALLSGRIPRT